MSRRNWILLVIVVAAIGVRLFRIDQPFIDRWSWRQSDVGAIARNYYTGGFRFAYPQIDWAGDAPGYVGTEFPILPFITALCYRAAGIHEWLGRIQAVVFFAIGAVFFFRIAVRLFGARTALWSLFFYAFAPLSIATSRAFMPDMPSLALALAGMFFYVRWLDEERRRDFIFAALLIALALLIKITTGIIAVPLGYLTFQRFSVSAFARSKLWFFAVIALLPSCLWYWHAHRVAVEFYPHHFFGAGGFIIESPSWYWRIAKQTTLSSLTPVLTLLALIGVVGRSGKFRLLFHWWAAAMLIFVVVVGWGNRHQWYQLPLVPIAAAFAGCACERVVRSRIAATGLALVFLANAAFATQPFFAPAATALRDAGLALKQIAPPQALVIAADDGDPTIFYYAERKGWHFLEQDGVFYGNPLDDAQLIADYDKLRRSGAAYAVFTFGTRWWLQYYGEFTRHLNDTAELVRDTPAFVIYRIRKP